MRRRAWGGAACLGRPWSPELSSAEAAGAGPGAELGGHAPLPTAPSFLGTRAPSLAGGPQRPRGHDCLGDVYAARTPSPRLQPPLSVGMPGQATLGGRGSTMGTLYLPWGLHPCSLEKPAGKAWGSPSSPRPVKVPMGLGHWHKAQTAAPGQLGTELASYQDLSVVCVFL